MRRPVLFFATFLPLLLPTLQAAAQPGAPRAGDGPPFHSEVEMVKLSFEPADPAQWRFGGSSSGAWRSWITANDMPADLRGRLFQADAFVAVQVDAAGHGQSCTLLHSSGDERLDRLSCDLLMRRASFPPHHVTPLRAEPTRWAMGVRWRTYGAAEQAERARRVPMPAIATPESSPVFQGWPRGAALDWLRVTSLPSIQPLYPRNAGQPREGVVSLDIFVSAGRGITRCAIGVSSGNAALDDAACRVARSLDLTYSRPCDAFCRESSLPLQVVWRSRNSHIRLPLPAGHYDKYVPPRDPADRRPADQRADLASRFGRPYEMEPLRRRDYPGINFSDAQYAQFDAELDVSRDGRVTGCRTIRSSEIEAFDRRTCALLIQRRRYMPMADVFGDVAAWTGEYWLGQYPGD